MGHDSHSVRQVLAFALVLIGLSAIVQDALFSAMSQIARVPLVVG
jgi:hypothetical protein